MLKSLAWLIPLLPLLASAWIGLGYVAGWNRGEAGERETAWVALGAVGLSFLHLLVLAIQSMWQGTPDELFFGMWWQSGDVGISQTFMLDGLGLGMALLVSLIALLTIRFSVNYMHREAGFQRFFFGLSLFASAMLLIVMAGDAALTFVGWELAGVSSYLLIAYNYDRSEAADNAIRAFVTNRIGDAGFILGIFLGFHWLNSVEWTAMAAGISSLDGLLVTLLALSFLVAALAKSAQVPFAPWISRALEGPTPSSAIFYGSLMVHAGVFLVIRLQPVFSQSATAMTLLVVFGVLSALYGWISGLVQTDIKSSLMFSTTGQVGLMFIWCGLGWFEFAAWHMALHAIWRAYQFLHAPALMNMTTRAARPAPAWLNRSRGLHTIAIQRFWLEPLANWLLVRPTRSLSLDVNSIDDEVVSRVVGLPAQVRAISSLQQWEREKRHGELAQGNIGQGSGVLGAFMEWLATLLHWFEDHLVLRGGGKGLINILHQLGNHLLRVDKLLSQPRYLLLLIMATFVVVL